MSLDIKKRTRNLYSKHRTNCPFKLAEKMNITILMLPLPQEVKGYCQRLLKQKYIVIDQSLSENERRFICAHELGHMILHKGFNHYFITRSTHFMIGKFERQANEFAVKLLSCGEQMEQGEPLEWYLRRCGVPDEMHSYFF